MLDPQSESDSSTEDDAPILEKVIPASRKRARLPEYLELGHQTQISCLTGADSQYLQGSGRPELEYEEEGDDDGYSKLLIDHQSALNNLPTIQNYLQL